MILPTSPKGSPRIHFKDYKEVLNDAFYNKLVDRYAMLMLN